MTEYQDTAYNIIPLDDQTSKNAISNLPEVKAAVAALKYFEWLPTLPDDFPKPDIFDFLEYTFGFQKDSLSNQREHVVLLLANEQSRHAIPDKDEAILDKATVDNVFNRSVDNYRKWLSHLDIQPAWKDSQVEDDKERELLLLSLYFLIWGEAANVRFLPECLCYIFHHMATKMLDNLTKQPAQPTMISFLDQVITPLYEVIAAEAANNDNGKEPHSTWRNYDDLNEYFWSVDCLKLDWPWDKTSPFFQKPKPMTGHIETARSQRQGKQSFVEHRTFLHLYHSFHRLWIFLVMMFQGLAIIAFNDGNFNSKMRWEILSLGPTFFMMKFIKIVLDVVMMYGTFSTTRRLAVCQMFFRFCSASVIMCILYVKTLHEESKQSSNSLIFIMYVSMIGIYVSAEFFLSFFMISPAWDHMTFQQNPSRLIRFINLINQERNGLFTRRSMFESVTNVIKYMLFWLVVLSGKFIFAYFQLIKPLVKPTRTIVAMRDLKYSWHEIGFKSNHNALIVASLWGPVIVIYLLDIYVFYSVISAIWGSVLGAIHGLGQIRYLEDVHRFFKEFPEAFMEKLHFPPHNRSSRNSSNQQWARSSLTQLSLPTVPNDSESSKVRLIKMKEDLPTENDVENRKIDAVVRFAPFWNEIIRNLRLEDYLTNSEMGLLLMPKNSGNLPFVQWPLFLLAGKIFEAVYMAENANSQDELWDKISRDFFMKSAVQECYHAFKFILIEILNVEGRMWVESIYKDIEASVANRRIHVDFQLNKLSLVVTQVYELIINSYRRGAIDDRDVEIYDTMLQLERDTDKAAHELCNVAWPDFLSSDKRTQYENSEEMNEVNLIKISKWPRDANLRTKVKRLYSIIEDSTTNIPKNVEARRRLEFFTNSLFMDLPAPKPVREMKSFSVLTPYYSETVLYSLDELNRTNEDGISTLFYLQKIFPDEWKNFLARRGLNETVQVENFTDETALELRFWASYRGQTLARTVRGMMYYRKALMLQSLLESVARGDVDNAFFVNDAKVTRPHESSLEAQALADLKFTYVVSCQIYGKQKAERQREAYDIELLMQRNEALRVAFIEEFEALKDGKIQKEFYSKLVKGVYIEGREKGQGVESWVYPPLWFPSATQEIYSIKLPGNPKLGEGKPENQNHAIIFTRGDAIQTIDMNQDNYFEEALKIRNLLEEFSRRDEKALKNRNLLTPTILGVREHVFTGSASSLASFMSNQETSFVTLSQRIMANPLKVRMHYGHPDVFDRVFHITRGGISKASRGINISEDIFAGFNSTLRGGLITHHEYIQVGKGRDVGFNQIALFEGKVAGGNGEQVLSRDVYRLGQRLNFFRMMSFYITTVGYYFCNMLTVLTVYIFIYGKAYLGLSGVGEELQVRAKIMNNTALSAALNTQLLFQIGVFTAVPMFLGFFLEQGLLRAVVSFIIMQIQLCSVFFTFSLGTRTHYFGRAILHGGASYQATGRGFVVRHIKFSENYRLYFRSHFVKGLEVVLLLVVDLAYGYNEGGALSSILFTVGCWFMALSWLFAPFLFNPSGFEWHKTVEDFNDWTKWLLREAGKDVEEQQSWEVWWGKEQAHIRTWEGRIAETILSLRFFVLHYGILYKLHIDSTSLLVYGLSGIVLAVLIILLMEFTFRQDVSIKYQASLRLFEVVCFLLTLACLVVAVVFTKLSVTDIFACILAFIPTGWGILSIAAAWKPMMEKMGLWKSIRSIAWLYDVGMGALIFFPIAILSRFPFVSPVQTSLMFNQDFSRVLEVSLFLAGNNANTS